MARIPVEKKGGGIPWWVWLLGLLAVAGIIWLLAEAFDDEPELADVEPVPEVVTPAPSPNAAMTEGTITDLGTILDASNPQEYVGREVDVTGVTARSVTGDSTYWIYNPDEGIDRRVFVVLYELGESQHGPGTGADGRYNVDEGNNMDVQGTIQAVEEDDPGAWGVTDDDLRRVREGQVYIRARSLENAEGGGSIRSETGG